MNNNEKTYTGRNENDKGNRNNKYLRKPKIITIFGFKKMVESTYKNFKKFYKQENTSYSSSKPNIKRIRLKVKKPMEISQRVTEE